MSKVQSGFAHGFGGCLGVGAALVFVNLLVIGGCVLFFSGTFALSRHPPPAKSAPAKTEKTEPQKTEWVPPKIDEPRVPYEPRR